jgi:hypothetical protein
MSILEFEGDTFIAFIDISGFKKMMKNEEKALKALDTFYSSGYQVLCPQDRSSDNRLYCRVEGLFISDSGFLFVRNGDRQNGFGLSCLLSAIKEINKKMLAEEIMLTTSIAYGHFKYQERIEFPGIQKNFTYGEAYVLAYRDNEIVTPKLKPGLCRIVKKGLPQDFVVTENLGQYQQLVCERVGDKQHYYFYWNLSDPDEIPRFEEDYRDSQYLGMLNALRRDG